MSTDTTDLTPARALPRSNILFLMSGSIACAKATQLISIWRKDGHAVRVAATPSVDRFVGRATLEGLSGAPVFDDTFAPGRAMDHVELARWADLVVVCPASANLLARFAHGIADDPVSTLWQACWGRGAPLFVVPAMNTRMWDYPATRHNVETLRRWGVHLVAPASGDLACGEQGPGRMPEPEDIRRQVEAVLAFERRGTARRVLITGGGTREPIDAVRYIGNHSTGATAAAVANALAERGHAVTWVGGVDARAPGPAVEQERFEGYADLDRALRRLLGEQRFDVVIHAAAVSDFSVERVGDGPAGEGKIASGEGLDLHLSPNPKLLPRLRSWSRNPALRVVGFKLTVDADAAAARTAVDRLFEGGACDRVVHNDFRDIEAGEHRYRLHDPDGDIHRAETVAELSDLLGQWLDSAVAAGEEART